MYFCEWNKKEKERKTPQILRWFTYIHCNCLLSYKYCCEKYFYPSFLWLLFFYVYSQYRYIYFMKYIFVIIVEDLFILVTFMCYILIRCQTLFIDYTFDLENNNILLNGLLDIAQSTIKVKWHMTSFLLAFNGINSCEWMSCFKSC